MQYFVTFLLTRSLGGNRFMHAFLGLIKDKSLDELDKIDNETRMQKLKNADRKKC
ncbi:hypothetical protein NHP164001_20020 [Helicobacter trogontum]|uniref:Uncharacterized protein n=1 Tax=Helicobacter trogontum TaxID=50960 RepID=A0ABQ0D6Z1_9HELI